MSGITGCCLLSPLIGSLVVAAVLMGSAHLLSAEVPEVPEVPEVFYSLNGRPLWAKFVIGELVIKIRIDDISFNTSRLVGFFSSRTVICSRKQGTDRLYQVRITYHLSGFRVCRASLNHLAARVGRFNKFLKYLSVSLIP